MHVVSQDSPANFTMTALNGIGEVENSDFNKAMCPDLLLSCNLQIYNLWDAAGPPVRALFLSASSLPRKPVSLRACSASGS